ncbi:hypothetical protein [Carboxydothermus ferrireducens]|uniref:Uncharacterized protein n=1 Tax=Carboxydothermus ferrireducens DSM 11255 TaxID=1119529 RepID=A0ABX2RBT2_9THEO|nr:hypothetical protein [Carboxydothermus ferrireducens]NYE57523.1 hypothetical protein [Carboxydothermus ferrireducens DSM 11255]
MAEWKYADYLAVKEDFIPVYTEHEDKKRRGSWKAFIPHQQMYELLDKLIAALDMESKSDIKPFWLTGAYGTGKTFASFVIKHILEDELTEVEEYFKKYSNIISLWPRFKQLREKNGKYVVVYLSGSGHITSDRRLLLEVQQAITERLRELGYNTFVPGIIDQMIEKLNILKWEQLFVKYRSHFRSVAAPEDVIAALQRRDLELSEIVARVLEEEGVTLTDSARAVKEWLKEVIVKNNLGGIVFIWDEFTEFFNQNRNVTTLQELAHVTQEIPFYWFLVTHRDLAQFTALDEDNRRKLLDRFHTCRLEMEEVTAYTLLGNAVEALPGKEEEWEDKRETLWQEVERILLHLNVLGLDKLNRGEAKKLVPIHPYAAYLLSQISKFYSSSQRTLFNFLKSDELGGFRWFIRENPRDDWYWLTADCLWQYFFESSENLTEMSEALNLALSHYESVKENIENEEERKILRVILLLIALSRQEGSINSLHRPLLSTVQRVAFRGTSLEQRVEEIAQKLEEKGIILISDLGAEREFLLPGTRVDDAKLRECKSRVKNFEKVLKESQGEGGFRTEIENRLSLAGAAKLRYPVQIVGAKDLRQRGGQVISSASLKPYQVGVALVLACHDEELYGLEEIAARVAEETGWGVVICEKTFGKKRWEAWQDHCAKAMYYEEVRDPSQKRYHENQMRKLSSDWFSELDSAPMQIFFRGRKWERKGIGSLGDFLEEEIGEIVFSERPEKISTTITLYNSSYGKTVAEMGLGCAKADRAPYREVVQELQKQGGVWGAKNLAEFSHHPLGRMQKVVDDFFARCGNKVILVELWEELQKPPFGLMPSPMGLLLFARLLRKYVDGYYFSDGVNSQPLNPHKLAEILDQVVKGHRNAGNYSIHRLSREGEKFCELARNLFNLSPEKTSYPEEARKNMREKQRVLGYPLWTIAYLAEGEDASFREALATLMWVLSYDVDQLKDEDMERIVNAVAPQAKKIALNLDQAKMEQGMASFLNTYVPALREFMSTLGLTVRDVREKLRGLLEEDVYLWKEEKVREKLPEVLAECELVVVLNELCGGRAKNVGEAVRHFQEVWWKSKLPLALYKKGQPQELAAAIAFLERVIREPRQAVKENRARDIRDNFTRLQEVLRNPLPVVIRLVEEATGEKIGYQEAEEIYQALPRLGQSGEEEVKRELEKVLATISKNKAIADLEEKWRELTDSPSPDEWSEKHRVPIQWVLAEREFGEFFEKFGQRRNLPKQEIEGLLSFLQERGTELEVVHDERYVLQKFLEAAAREYASLVQEEEMARKLQDYIYQKMGGEVRRWVIEQGRVLGLAREWINGNYRQVFYPRVEEVLATLPPQALKEFVSELAREDSLIGMRLLAAFERKEG